MTTGVTNAVVSLKHLLETPTLFTALSAEVSKIHELYALLSSAERHPIKPSNDMEFLQTVLSQDHTTGVSK